MMMALTLTQPWASLVGIKMIETRCWRDDFRGRLAIHAAKGFPKGFTAMQCEELMGQEPFKSALASIGIHRMTDLPFGCVVATCNLIGIVRIPPRTCLFMPNRHRPTQWENPGLHSIKERAITLPPAEPERSFGDYTPGRFAWLLADVVRLAAPVPVGGAQKLWKWDERPYTPRLPGVGAAGPARRGRASRPGQMSLF